MRDRSGRKSYYDYDPLKRLVRTQDASGNSATHDYDPNGNLIRLLDSKGSSTRWHYDSLNRSDKKTYIDGTFDSYVYDAVANTQSRTDAKGQTTTSYYDPAGNLVKSVYPTMPSVTLQYDGLNRVSSMTDALGTRNFGYDVLNRVTSMGGIYGNDAVSYSYDNVGRRASMSVGNGASAGTTNTTYGYDALSRLSTLTSPVGTWTYAYVGNTSMASSLTKPNGTVTNYSYDGMDRLTQVQNKKSSGVVLSNYAYGYDTRDVRTSMERAMGSDPTQHINYSYDSTSQLTGETANETTPLMNVPYVNNSYAYDAMGNRSTTSSQSLNVGGSQTVNSVTTIVNRLNQLTSQTSSTSVNGAQSSTRTDSFAYDANGNLQGQSTSANSSGTSYVYDEADRLTVVVQKDANGTNSQKSEFVYDGFGRKVISREYSWDGTNWVLTTNSEVRRIYDGMDVVQERDVQNAIRVNYTRNGNIGGILARTDISGSCFYNYDGGGSVTQLTDAQQNSVAEYSYDAYGNTLRVVGTQAAANLYRFSTKELHVASGLYDYGYRFYSSALGRWINRDPIREQGGLNLYAMVGNNPVNNWDEYGLIAPILAGVIIGGVVGGGTNAVGQISNNLFSGKPWYCIDWWDVGNAAVVGAITGAAMGANPVLGLGEIGPLAGALGRNALIGAAGNMWQGHLSNWHHGQGPVSVGGTLINGVTGAAGGLFGGLPGMGETPIGGFSPIGFENWVGSTGGGIISNVYGGWFSAYS